MSGFRAHPPLGRRLVGKCVGMEATGVLHLRLGSVCGPVHSPGDTPDDPCPHYTQPRAWTLCGYPSPLKSKGTVGVLSRVSPSVRKCPQTRSAGLFPLPCMVRHRPYSQAGSGEWASRPSQTGLHLTPMWLASICPWHNQNSVP
ncbi:hypothetical protein H8959_003817 [Pygathrix nigripes]